MSRARLIAAFALVASGCGARSDLPNPKASPASSVPQRIYIAETHSGIAAAARLVRVNDLKGAHWTTFSGGDPPFTAICSPALDDQERIYFADVAHSRLVRTDDMSGSGLETFGVPGTGVGGFVSPLGVALDGEGRIYVADADAHRVVRLDDFSGAGWVSIGGPAPGAGAGMFNNPSGIAISSKGKILIGDMRNHRIVEMDDLSGAGWTTWDMPGKLPEESFPWGVAYDAEQRIYAVDFQSSVLHRIDSIAGGGHVSFSEPSLVQMSHVFVHRGGRIFLTMLNGNDIVASMDGMNGEGLTTFGTFGEGVNQFIGPCGIAVW
jgi:streptogramin lyase